MAVRAATPSRQAARRGCQGRSARGCGRANAASEESCNCTVQTTQRATDSHEREAHDTNARIDLRNFPETFKAGERACLCTVHRTKENEKGAQPHLGNKVWSVQGFLG
jgi:hypothetical protein